MRCLPFLLLAAFALPCRPVPVFAAPVSPPSPTSETVDLSRFFAGYEGAFVLQEVATGRTIRYNPTRCAKRFAPCSTFKIPNSLIFVETGVVREENQREKWDGKKRPLDIWNRDQTLKTAYAASAVWYYQRLSARVGAERTRRYVQALRYGNQAVPSRFDDGPPHFWLDGPLAISAEEQVQFLKRLQAGNVPFAPRTQAIVKRVMVQQRSGNAVLRGKTGTDGSWSTGVTTLGWYVGYVEKAGRPYLFAANITGGVNPSGPKAKAIVLRILKSRGLL
ncbi:MAG: class D beta-lactamase [Cytophagales bacterium]|nr:class D beta-lactamase [Armatimonadota bacterium]